MINRNYTKRTEFSYYIQLYDLQVRSTNSETLTNEYQIGEFKDSYVYAYIPLFEQNLLERKNWIKLNKRQGEELQKIDFSFTNLARIQTNSIVHNRILLDTDHFISNKGFYYEKFQTEEFCPIFEKVNTENIKMSKTFKNNPIILKPDNGTSSQGIQIFNNCTDKNISDHINIFKKYQEWTISKLYISRLFNGYIITNRFFYLVRKTRKYNTVTFDGFWYDEFINYRAFNKFRNINDIDNYDEFLKIFVTNYDGSSTDFYKNRVIDSATYLKLFTSAEYKIIKEKITEYITLLTEKIGEHATCSNDYTPNNDNNENTNITFHLYGIDSIITDDLNIKFIEINGAPGLNGGGYDKINYKKLINDVCKLVIDTLYEPKFVPIYENESSGKFIKCGQYIKKLKTPVYFVKEIVDQYPFILNGFFSKERSCKFQRIKNPKSKSIHLFYGPRDLYVHDLSSYNYYDEIIEWNKSENGRNAKILNKIQGITYFLASKDKFHQTLNDYDFVPKSFIYNFGDDQEEIIKFIRDIRKKNPNEYFIIKPVHGSQGKGIVIMQPELPIEMFFDNMKLTKQEYGYSSFAISRYINNPKLYNEKKFNLRFYFMVHIKKLPTHLDMASDVNIYILRDTQVYYTVLPYNTNIDGVLNEFIKICPDENKINIANKISELTILDIKKSIHITNLQIVKDLSEKLDVVLPLKNFVGSLEEMNFDDAVYNSIKSQAYEMIKKSIDSVKFNIRPLNRLINNSSAFNLLACDTMLDSNNKLHLIEINRGPDLHGLKLTIGNTKITNIFSEMFDIIIDDKQDNISYFDKHEILY
jgi:glutathione synthase/RimK-type ligase-like ATP-grasp enzyme